MPVNNHLITIECQHVDKITQIIKYDLTGKPILSFGRNYKRIQFSESAKKTHQKRYAEAIKRGWEYKMLPKYPPVIRKVFLDSKENVWIVSGEASQDVEDKLIDVEVDTFNENGIWLYSFKTNNIVNQSLSKMTDSILLHKYLRLTTSSILMFTRYTIIIDLS